MMSEYMCTLPTYFDSCTPSLLLPPSLPPSLPLSLSCCRGTHGKGAEQFLHSLEDLLHTMCRLMKVECPEGELVTPRVQAQSLQFFPQTFDLFLSVMSVHTLGSVSTCCVVLG